MMKLNIRKIQKQGDVEAGKKKLEKQKILSHLYTKKNKG